MTEPGVSNKVKEFIRDSIIPTRFPWFTSGQNVNNFFLCDVRRRREGANTSEERIDGEIRGRGIRGRVFETIKLFKLLNRLGSPTCSSNIIAVLSDDALSLFEVRNGLEISLGTLVQQLGEPLCFSSSSGSQYILTKVSRISSYKEPSLLDEVLDVRRVLVPIAFGPKANRVREIFKVLNTKVLALEV